MMFALSAPMLVVPMVAGWMTRWLAPGLIAGAGLLLIACGQLWLAQCAPGQPIVPMLAAMFVIGAFHLLLYVLAAITALSALMVFGFLLHSRLPHDQASGLSAEPAPPPAPADAVIQ